MIEKQKISSPKKIVKISEKSSESNGIVKEVVTLSSAEGP